MINICNYLQEEDILYILDKYKLGKRISHLKRVADYTELLLNLVSSKFECENYERNMLRFAALLHDIGYFFGKEEHHKYSKYIVLSDMNFDSLPLELRAVLAVIVYSHRRKLDIEIDKYEQKEKIQILKLISILRLADALDFNKKDVIDEAYTAGNFLCIKLLEAPDSKELEKFNRKIELFKESFQMEILISV